MRSVSGPVEKWQGSSGSGRKRTFSYFESDSLSIGIGKAVVIFRFLTSAMVSESSETFLVSVMSFGQYRSSFYFLPRTIAQKSLDIM